MTDFVSQASLTEGLKLPPDMLGHDHLSAAVLDKVIHFPPGAVFALQGPWGRGKTDLLARIALRTIDEDDEYRPSGIARRAFWINPWQYGTPDLLTPLVLAMLSEVAPETKKSRRDALWTAAESIIRAGFSFGLKAMAAVIPGADVLKVDVDAMLKGVFERIKPKDGSAAPRSSDPDPVAVMGARFRQLVDELVSGEEREAGGRLLVCIDDLDRCLPHRQVALLEAIRFLTSAGAPVTFLVALDPTLARQAVLTHYRSDYFDPERYLDKMFHLRINLPALAPEDLTRLVRGHMVRPMLNRQRTGEQPLRRCLVELLGDRVDQLETFAARALAGPDLRNPRVVKRIFDRLYLLSSAVSEPLPINDDDETYSLLLWLGIIERWPELRAVLQDAGEAHDFERRFEKIHRKYLLNLERSDAEDAILDRLPSPQQSPELRMVFSKLCADPDACDLIHAKGSFFFRLDRLLIAAGL
ncbi:MAG: hypothetical protein KC609_04820 [Myxococcales bacterium]|nr:hypothetical protein [Myxococcales bacterium]